MAFQDLGWEVTLFHHIVSVDVVKGSPRVKRKGHKPHLSMGRMAKNGYALKLPQRHIHLYSYLNRMCLWRES